jgi:hypothetical protein
MNELAAEHREELMLAEEKSLDAMREQLNRIALIRAGWRRIC